MPDNRQRGDDRNEPANPNDNPDTDIVEDVLAFSPAKALPLLLAASPKQYRISLNPCGPALFKLDSPCGMTQAMAVGIRATALGIKTPITAHVATVASSFLPRYSGVRPIMSPAMNTVMSTWNNMQYMPHPMPPKMISPIRMFHIGISPASGIQLSCIELTEPLSIAVQDTPPEHAVHHAEALFFALHVRKVPPVTGLVRLENQAPRRQEEGEQTEQRQASGRPAVAGRSRRSSTTTTPC